MTVTIDDTDLVLNHRGRTTRLRHIPGPLQMLLVGHNADDTQEERLRESSQRLLARLGNLVETSLYDNHQEVMRHQSTTRSSRYQRADLATDATVRLDRFAFLRTRDDRLVLECPRSTHRFILTSGFASNLAAHLATPQRVGNLIDSADGKDLAADVLNHWVGAGLVEQAHPDGTFPTDTDPSLLQWEFHDLLMHSRSRSGRYDDPLGALGTHRGRVEPLPAIVAPREVAGSIDLPRPAPRKEGLSLAAALEGRRSIRDYADAAMSVEELATFLHRAFRDRARFDPPAGGDQESKVSRPYPSGGGLYEHELYLTVRRCAGLAPGVYHYDAFGHRLELITADPASAHAMLAVAAAATGHPASPDVLLTLTARFQRMSWRYRSISYANVLRTTGAIYQTMYLVATDLDLAPCALGNGDADLCAQILGLDYLRESSVGDFILGRRDPSDVVEGEPLTGWTLLGGAENT
ncbi:MAG: SagB family peptide dehydrogenase [Ornithinimicrobium sp.]